MGERGKFCVVDGLDGVGKGVVEKAILDEIGKPYFDSISWCKENLGVRPSLDEVGDYDVVLAGEPTYSGLGLDIRGTLIANRNRGRFPADLLVRAYSVDREIQMRNLIVPLVESGRTVVQSRSLATSLCYQTLNAEDEGLDPLKIRQEILMEPGNVYQLTNAPDLLIIQTIGDVGELMRRLKAREKEDDAIFENEPFLLRAKEHYESDWLREIFEGRGTEVVYLDAGISVESSEQQARDIWSSFVERFPQFS
jgi:thymidylate kinase